MFVLGQVIPRRKPQVFAHSLPLLPGHEVAHPVPVIPSQVAHNSTLRHPDRDASPSERLPRPSLPN
jgi:hypothetical protein